MNIKRLISFSLIITMLLVCFQPVLAEENTFEDEIKDLKLLGIIKDDIEFDSLLVRGDFAQYIIRMTGFTEDTIKQEEVIFTDVSPEHKNFDAITYCAKQGYMTGFGQQTFRPDDGILAEQAIKVLVSILGYDYLAISQGGYPQGYLLTANNLGLLKGIDVPYGKNLLFAEAAKLIHNALKIPIVRLTGVGDDYSYNIDENITLASLYFNVYNGKGVLEANDIAAINGYAIAQEDYIVIGGTEFYTDDINVYNYIGYDVNFMYRINEEKGRNEILSLSCSDKTKDVTINRKDFVSITAGNVNYVDDNERNVNIAIPRVFDFIYNGEKEVFDSSKIVNSKYGQLKLVSSYGNTYNLLIYNDFTSVKVGRIDKDEYAVFDEKSGIKYDFNPMDKNVVITDKFGSQIDFSAIKVSDVLTITKNTNYIKAEVSSERKSVEIIEKNISDGYLLTNESKYSFAGDKANIINLIGYSVPVTLYFDVYGNIAEFDINKEGNSKRWGFLIKVKESGSNDYEKKIYIKAYTDAGCIETFILNENPVVNGAKKYDITEGEVKTILLAGNTFAFLTNSDGEIREIQTARPAFGEGSYTQYEDGFSLILSGEHVYSGTSITKSFGTRAYIGPKTVVLHVPETINLEKAQDSDFYIVTPTASDQAYNLKAYAFSKNDKYADVITISGGTMYEVSIKDSMGIVTKKTEVADDDGTKKTKLYVMVDNKETVVYIDDENIIDINSSSYYYEQDKDAYGSFKIKDVKVGDVISYVADINMNIRCFGYIYTPLAQYIHYQYQTESTSYRIIKASVKEIDEEFITFDTYMHYNSSAKAWIDSAYPESARHKNAAITIVRKAGNGYIVTPGTINDIEITDQAIVQYKSRGIVGIIVYK